MRYVFFIFFIFLITGCQNSNVTSQSENNKTLSVQKGVYGTHKRKDMLFLATGDLIGASYVEVAMKAYGKEYPFKKIRPLIEKADISFANLECVITGKGALRSHHKRKINYDASSLVYESLLTSGFNVFSMANNHVYDMGADGLEGMIQLFTPSPFLFGGAGTIEEASKPVYATVNGLKVAFVFYFGNDRAFAATKKKIGYNYIDFQDLKKAKKTLRRDLSKIDDDTDITILSIHWGPNYTTEITDKQKAFAHYAVDQGVDLFLGHSAHIFHAVEIYKKHPILYDMGDIMINDDDNWDTRSFLFYLTVENGQFTGLKLVPIYITNSQIRRAYGLMADTIINRFVTLSKSFNLTLRKEKEMLNIVIP